MENLKRNVFLFGAGAVNEWGGPKTQVLTDLLTKAGFKTKDGNTITSHIRKTLEDNGYSVNFETILSVIEELIIYFSGFKASVKNRSFLNLFLSQNNLLCFYLNYTIVGDIKSNYSLNIPNHDVASSMYTKNRQNPDQFFFELLLINLYTAIEIRVDNYSHSYNGIQRKIESNKNQKLNDAFTNWIKSFIEQDEIVRLYTLNYDRLNKIILKNRGIDVFEGFSNEVVFPNNEKLIEPDIKRIVIDTNCLCNYNLHGCTNWKLAKLKNNKNYLPFLKEGVHLSSNYNESPKFKIEEGKYGIHTSIISGYQKAQRSALSPYKQMQAAFDRDCFIANNLYIIGYSFGDEHINESIRMALIFNKKLQIHIIDYCFLENLEAKYYSEFASLKLFRIRKKVSENIYSYGNAIANNFRFSDFLFNQEIKRNEK